MSFVNISAIRTTDPGSPGVAKTSFRASDPFAIAIDIQVDSSVVQAGLLFDQVRQIINPREDPNNHAWWSPIAGDIVHVPTIDHDWTGATFQWGTAFWTWVSWPHYSDVVSHIAGPDKLDGIFYVQGTVNVQGSDLFANSGQFWFKVRP